MVITEKDLGPYKSREEIWAERIRLNKELVEWPFTMDIVKAKGVLYSAETENGNNDGFETNESQKRLLNRY